MAVAVFLLSAENLVQEEAGFSLASSWRRLQNHGQRPVRHPVAAGPGCAKESNTLKKPDNYYCFCTIALIV